MAKRVNTGDTVFVLQCPDEAILFPTPGAAKKAMLEDNQWAFPFDCVVDLLSAGRDEWHVIYRTIACEAQELIEMRLYRMRAWLGMVEPNPL
jgi:hypothetical protein